MKEEAVIEVSDDFVPSARYRLNRGKDITFMQPLFSIVFKILFLVLLGFALSCRQRETPSVARDTISFATENHQAVEIIQAKAILSAQQIVLEVKLPTAKGEPFIIDHALGELITAEGNRAIPIEVINGHRSGSSVATLIFEPVHSRELFQRTGLRGDVEPEYVLVIKYPEGSEQKNISIKLTTEKDLYQESLKEFGIASNVLAYKLGLDARFAAEQEEHFDKIPVSNSARPEHTIHTTENEILMNGLWLKILAHYRRDTLYVDMRIVNQFLAEINLDLNSITLSDGDLVKAHNLPEDRNLNIPNGRRAQSVLKFRCSTADRYELDLSGLTVADKISVFSKPVVLEKTELYVSH